MPNRRPYRLGKRAASVARTRTRILEAATTEYARNGVENTTMQAVARRADVAAGTVLYHYPTPEDLTRAVVSHWLDQIEPPSAEAVDPSAPLETRVAEVITELFRFYQRSEWAHQIYKLSPDNPVLLAARAQWERSFDDLVAAAIGDHVGSPTATRLTGVFMDADFFGLLLAHGFTSAEATQASIDLIVNLATND